MTPGTAAVVVECLRKRMDFDSLSTGDTASGASQPLAPAAGGGRNGAALTLDALLSGLRFQPTCGAASFGGGDLPFISCH